MEEGFIQEAFSNASDFDFTKAECNEIGAGTARRQSGDRDTLLPHPSIMVLNAHGPTSPSHKAGSAAMRKALITEILSTTFPDIVLLQEVQWVDFTDHVSLLVSFIINKQINKHLLRFKFLIYF